MTISEKLSAKISATIDPSDTNNCGGINKQCLSLFFKTQTLNFRKKKSAQLIPQLLPKNRFLKEWISRTKQSIKLYGCSIQKDHRNFLKSQDVKKILVAQPLRERLNYQACEGVLWQQPLFYGSWEFHWA